MRKKNATQVQRNERKGFWDMLCCYCFYFQWTKESQAVLLLSNRKKSLSQELLKKNFYNSQTIVVRKISTDFSGGRKNFVESIHFVKTLASKLVLKILMLWVFWLKTHKNAHSKNQCFVCHFCQKMRNALTRMYDFCVKRKQFKCSPSLKTVIIYYLAYVNWNSSFFAFFSKSSKITAF